MNLEYPVLVNTNGQVQDKSGVILLTIKNYFMDERMRNFADLLVQVMNEEPAFFPALQAQAYQGTSLPLPSTEDAGKVKGFGLESNGNGHAPSIAPQESAKVEVDGAVQEVAPGQVISCEDPQSVALVEGTGTAIVPKQCKDFNFGEDVLAMVIRKALRKSKIKDISMLAAMSDKDLLKLPRIGAKAVQRIRDMLGGR